MRTINHVALVGRLANDPELHTTQSGISFANFRIAVQRRYANAQGVREADFISCVAWRQTAEFIQRYFIKGNMIGLTGSIQTRTYDAQDGSKRYVTEVVVDNAEFVSAKGDSGQSGGNAQKANASQGQSQQQSNRQEQLDFNSMEGFTEVEDDDELPF